MKEPSSAEVAAKAAADMNAAPVHTGLRVKLLGTLLAGLPEWSIASIQDVVTLKTTTYMVGDKVQTAEILEIERARVLVLNNNRREFIDAVPGDGNGAPVVAVAAVVKPDTGPKDNKLGEGIKKNRRQRVRGAAQRDRQDAVEPQRRRDAGAHRLPAFKDGVAQKASSCFSIRPDSIYTKIGVQNGDVLKRINGYDLNSPEKALEIYSKLKEANRIDIEVERNGSTVRSTYNVR